ncbi:MAG: ribosome-associated translation inhibitor RaiA [Bdellovibrionales bacterium]|nr:ribosome-associated translation inhibitor RaiA [Bdellovibrionales bacterium]
MFHYQIDFPDSQVSPAVKERIEDELNELGNQYTYITSCHIAVRIPHKHKGRPFFHIHVKLEVPGKTFVIDREPETREEHRDVYLALRDTFDILERKLRKHNQKLKNHMHHKEAI